MLEVLQTTLFSQILCILDRNFVQMAKMQRPVTAFLGLKLYSLVLFFNCFVYFFVKFYANYDITVII